MSYNYFLVEDGTAVPEANAYITIQYSLNYHGSRGNAYWSTLALTAQQQAIVRASEYLDIRFGPRFRGRKLTLQQGLQWPRGNAFDNSRYCYSGIDSVPRNLQKACAEYAIRAASLQTLAPDPPMLVNPQDLSQNPPTGGGTAEVSNGMIVKELDKVGPIEEEHFYANPLQLVEAIAKSGKSPMSSTVADFWIPEYPMADMWLEQLIRNESRRLIRG